MIEIGDVYEDCSYHPVLCTESEGDDVAGISLWDFSEPRSCSVEHCGVRVLEPAEVAFKLRRRDDWLAAESAWRERQDSSVYDALLTAQEKARRRGL